MPRKRVSRAKAAVSDAKKAEVEKKVHEFILKNAKQIAAGLLYHHTDDYEEQSEIEDLVSYSAEDFYNEIEVDEDTRQLFYDYVGGSVSKEVRVTITNASDLRKLRDEVDGSCLSQRTKDAILKALED